MSGTNRTHSLPTVHEMEEVDRDIFEIHAAFCSVFVSPTRLRIMWLLAEDEQSVGMLASKLGLSMSNVSQHLRVMRDHGAVRTRRRGHSIIYRIANPKFIEGAKAIREGLVEEINKMGSL